MCKDFQSGELDIDVMKKDLGGDLRLRYQSDIRKLKKRMEEREPLLEWANDLLQARTSFLLFLSGALSLPTQADGNRRQESKRESRGAAVNR